MDTLKPTLQGLPDPATFLVELSGRYPGGTLTRVMGVLFTTSILAAIFALHTTVARYTFVADSFGVTHAVDQSPHAGSLILTTLAPGALSVFVALGRNAG